ncbi:MAG: hypothetical protein IH600_05230 [Bacteroidetes bacterium]|nr:hypothetical protein [Bacteroidota bacterium]
MIKQEYSFKRRNDLYYITLLVYVAFAVLYIVVTGTITDDTVEFGLKDPVVYIIAAFVVHALIMLLTSIVRKRRLVITEDALVFASRFHERFVPFADIERITLKRERRRLNTSKLGDRKFAVIKLHVSGRRRVLRLRVANYEREKELYQLLKKLKHERKV